MSVFSLKKQHTDPKQKKTTYVKWRKCSIMEIIGKEKAFSQKRRRNVPPKLKVYKIFTPEHEFWFTSCYCCCCSAAKSCPILCDLMDCSTLGSSVLHYILEYVQIYDPWVGDAINHLIFYQPLLHFAFNLSQQQSLLQWISSFHQATKGLKLQLQSFQWLFSVDFL